MNGQQAAESLRRERHYLQNVLKDFQPEHGDFRPADGMLTVAQHVMHLAWTLDWFRQGAFGEGFDMDFEKAEARNREPVPLTDAITFLDLQYADYEKFLASLSEADLFAPMAANPIFGEAPRVVVLHAQTDHTAHHRGSLSVYLRLLGITPTMVYTE